LCVFHSRDVREAVQIRECVGQCVLVWVRVGVGVGIGVGVIVNVNVG